MVDKDIDNDVINLFMKVNALEDRMKEYMVSNDKITKSLEVWAEGVDEQLSRLTEDVNINRNGKEEILDAIENIREGTSIVIANQQSIAGRLKMRSTNVAESDFDSISEGMEDIIPEDEKPFAEDFVDTMKKRMSKGDSKVNVGSIEDEYSQD